MRPKQADVGAIPFFLTAVGRGQDAASFLKRWRDWFSFEVCEMVFAYANLVQSINSTPPRRVSRFVSELSSIGTLAAALSFHELPRAKRKRTGSRLARYANAKRKLDLQKPIIANGISGSGRTRKSGAIALSLGRRPRQ